MDTPQPHEVNVVDGDDSSSIVSFEDIPPRSRPRYRHSPHMASMPRMCPKTEILKIDGKVPDVLHVVKYLGWQNNVIECQSSAMYPLW